MPTTAASEHCGPRELTAITTQLGSSRPSAARFSSCWICRRSSSVGLCFRGRAQPSAAIRRAKRLRWRGEFRCAMAVAMDADDTRVLAEQQQYYCERAPEYDDWWERRRQHAGTPEEDAQWWREVAEVRAAFDAAPLGGDVLELAGGTGIWSEVLAARAERLTVLDGSPEVLALNRARLSARGLRDRVTLRECDLFEWAPARTHDAVFFAFWLSHVPSSRVDAFLGAVSAALRPGGCLALLDNRPYGYGNAHRTERVSDEMEVRTLSNGRRHSIIKRFDDPAGLVDKLNEHGIRAEVHTTDQHFIYGVGRKEVFI